MKIEILINVFSKDKIRRSRPGHTSKCQRRTEKTHASWNGQSANFTASDILCKWVFGWLWVVFYGKGDGIIIDFFPSGKWVHVDFSRVPK